MSRNKWDRARDWGVTTIGDTVVSGLKCTGLEGIGQTLRACLCKYSSNHWDRISSWTFFWTSSKFKVICSINWIVFLLFSLRLKSVGRQRRNRGIKWVGWYREQKREEQAKKRIGIWFKLKCGRRERYLSYFLLRGLWSFYYVTIK